VIYFVRTRAEYTSYTDFWELVSLSGFSTVYADEVDPASDNIYILPFINAECGNGWEGARAKIIHWCSEWYHDPPLVGARETWHFDLHYANQNGLRYVPMGSHPNLARGTILNDTHYDVAYLAYMIPRRSTIHTELERKGILLSPTSAWGDERHTILMNSRAYLHVHQFEETPGVPGLRMVVAAAYKLPVIMEYVPERGAFGYNTFIAAAYEHLGQTTLEWLRHDIALREYGCALYDFLCNEYTFRKSIEAAL